MALPAIAPYPMPSAGDLPTNRVAWTVDPRRAALLIHDMQEHFLRAFDRTAEPVPQLLAAISELRDACHAAGVPVIYSAQPGGQTAQERGLLLDFWGDGISDDPAHAAIVPDLAPAPHDTQLTKWRYSAFVRTDLHEQLRNHGRDQLLICGIYAHIGCLMTAAQAFMEEIQPFLIADAVADFSRADHEQALSWAARRCAMTVCTDEVLSELRAATATPPAAAIRARLAALLDADLRDLGDEDDAFDAGLDSVRLLTLLGEWRAAGYAVEFDEVVEEPTIAAWARLLTERSGAPLARPAH